MISPSALRRRRPTVPPAKRSFIFRKSRFARGIHYVGGVQEEEKERERERDTTKANHYSFHWSRRPDVTFSHPPPSSPCSIPPSQIIFCTQTRMLVLIQEVSSENILHYQVKNGRNLFQCLQKKRFAMLKMLAKFGHSHQCHHPASRRVVSVWCCVVLSKNFNYMSLSRRCHRTRRVCNFFAHHQS